MKKSFIVVLSVLFYNCVFAQYTTIKTPTGVTVEAIYLSELSINTLALVEQAAAIWISDHGSNAVRVSPASQTYNCHAFAWHVSDGGNRVWVNQNDQNGSANVSKYWSGNLPTYQTASPTNATKAFYPNGDHSAKVISAGVFESKWGAWPRYRHSPSDCPYVSTNILYEYIPINGSNFVCSSENYSTLNIQGATYNWTGNNVSVSGSGSTTTATKISNGSSTISSQISSPYSNTTISANKSIWSGLPSNPTISAIQTSGDGEPTTYKFIANGNGVNFYNWYVNNILKSSNNYPNNLFHWYFPANVTKTIECKTSNTCGTSTFSNSITITGEYKWGHNYSIYPNPANSEITISQIEIKELYSNEVKPIFIKSIEIVDKFGVTLFVKRIESGTKEASINISNLPNGIYLIKINEGIETENYTILKN